MLDILAAPFAACLVIAGIHCCLGIHVVMREVIFVDLALAQIAATGAAVDILFGFEPHSSPAYICSLGFTFLGAGVFSLGRFRDRRVPQEAIIGIVYVVSSAVAILILSKVAVEREELESMLIGRLLFVDWPEVGRTLLIYLAVGATHIVLRRQFFTISRSAERAERSGINIRLWDFVFYMTFGIVVSRSVQMAGVLLGFSFLVVPAVCSMMFFASIGKRPLAGWVVGFLASLGGLYASARWDFPTGASVVATLGTLLICCSIVYSAAGTVRWRRAALRGGANGSHSFPGRRV